MGFFVVNLEAATQFPCTGYQVNISKCEIVQSYHIWSSDQTLFTIRTNLGPSYYKLRFPRRHFPTFLESGTLPWSLNAVLFQLSYSTTQLRTKRVFASRLSAIYEKSIPEQHKKIHFFLRTCGSRFSAQTTAVLVPWYSCTAN